MPGRECEANKKNFPGRGLTRGRDPRILSGDCWIGIGGERIGDCRKLCCYLDPASACRRCGSGHDFAVTRIVNPERRGLIPGGREATTRLGLLVVRADRGAGRDWFPRLSASRPAVRFGKDDRFAAGRVLPNLARNRDTRPAWVSFCLLSQSGSHLCLALRFTLLGVERKMFRKAARQNERARDKQRSI